MKKIIYFILLSLAIIAINGCGSGSSEPDSERVKIDSFKILLIGNAKSRYQLDNMEDNDSYTLDEVGSSSSDLSNVNDPIIMNSGQFYIIDFNFKTTKAYPNGVDFSFVIVDEKSVENVTEDDYHKLLYYTNSGKLTNPGEHSIKANIFISTDIPVGRYALVVNAIDKNTKKSQERNVKKLPMSGSVYIDIKKDNNAKRAELVDVNGSKYIDLPYIGEIIDGHTNKKVGSASLVVYNTSDKDEKLTVSAQLELENGKIIELSLLDNNDKTIKDRVDYILPVSENYTANVRKMNFSYYLREEDYVSLVDSLPDLSVNQNSDGLKGKVIWNIQSENPNLVTNNIENSVLLTKFLDNFNYTNLAALLKPNEDLNLIAQTKPLSDNTDLLKVDAKIPTYNIMDYIDDRPMITATLLADSSNDVDLAKISQIDAAYMYGGGNLLSGKKIVGYIKNKMKPPVKETKEFFDYSFDKIDAAFKMPVLINEFSTKEVIYFFRGDKYIIYDIEEKSTSDSASIWELDFLRDINDSDKSFFDRIDAAVYHNSGDYDSDGIYFFNANEYILISYRGAYQQRGYTRGYIKNRDGWGDIEHITAAFSDGSKVIFFNNLETKIGMTKKNMFKYGGKVDEFSGDKKWGAIGFKGDYNIKGTWKVPGVEGDAKANVVAYLNNKAHNIISVTTEAEVNIGKKHPAISDVARVIESRIGGKISIKLFKSEIYKKGDFFQLDVTDTLKADETTEAYSSASSRLIGFDLVTEKYSWKKKQTLITIYFAAGPVPISIKAGFDGNLSVGAKLGIQDIGISPEITAPTKLAVWVEAGVEVLLLKVGLGGEVILIKLEPTASLLGKLNLASDGTLNFDANTKVTFDLSLIQANLYAAFVIDLWLTSITKKFTIYKTPWLFQREWTLLDKNILSTPLPL